MSGSATTTPPGPTRHSDDATPAERFSVDPETPGQRVGFGGSRGADPGRWSRRRAPRLETATTGSPAKSAANGIVCVSWQQVSVGKHRAGERCDVLVTDQLMQFWIGAELLKTVTRTSSGEVRKKHAQGSSGPGLTCDSECQGSTEVDPSRINRRRTAPLERCMPSAEA